MAKIGKLIYSGDKTHLSSMNRKITKSVGQSKNSQMLFKVFGPPPELGPIEVRIADGNFEVGFKKFKLLFQRERVVGRLKEKQHYEKPSEKKRRKRREALERRLLAESRERMMASGEWDKRQKRKAKKRQQRLEQRIKQQESSEDLD